MAQLTDQDEGKPVVDADGEKVGVVSTVKGGKAYVDPDPSVTDQLMRKLGWGDVDEDHYPLEQDRIDAVTDDEIRLRR